MVTAMAPRGSTAVGGWNTTLSIVGASGRRGVRYTTGALASDSPNSFHAMAVMV